VSFSGDPLTADEDLNHLTYVPGTSYERLESRDIGKLSSLTSLTTLDLHGWRQWDDLSPLGQLPLLELTCSDTCMLVDVLGPSALQMLTSITLNPMTSGFEFGSNKQWLDARAVTEETALVMASDALISLPDLAILTCRANQFENNYERVLFNPKKTVQTIVTLHPEHWRNLGQLPWEVIFNRIRG